MNFEIHSDLTYSCACTHERNETISAPQPPIYTVWYTTENIYVVVSQISEVGGLRPTGKSFLSFVRARAAVCKVRINLKNDSRPLFPLSFSPRDFFPFPVWDQVFPFLWNEWDQGNPGEIKWVQVNSNEIKWMRVNRVRSSETKWIQVNPSEIKWIQMCPSEFKWNQMSPSEPKWDQVSASEFKWNPLNPSEPKWDQVSPSETKWVQVNSSETPLSPNPPIQF